MVRSSGERFGERKSMSLDDYERPEATTSKTMTKERWDSYSGSFLSLVCLFFKAQMMVSLPISWVHFKLDSFFNLLNKTVSKAGIVNKQLL